MVEEWLRMRRDTDIRAASNEKKRDFFTASARKFSFLFFCYSTSHA